MSPKNLSLLLMSSSTTRLDKAPQFQRMYNDSSRDFRWQVPVSPKPDLMMLYGVLLCVSLPATAFAEVDSAMRSLRWTWHGLNEDIPQVNQECEFHVIARHL